jgi:hypothetical protein
MAWNLRIGSKMGLCRTRNGTAVSRRQATLKEVSTEVSIEFGKKVRVSSLKRLGIAWNLRVGSTMGTFW